MLDKKMLFVKKKIPYAEVVRLVEEGKNLKEISAALKISDSALLRRRKKDVRLDNILGEVTQSCAQPMDYALVKTLAQVNCAEFEIANKVGLTPEGFSRRKKWDEKLQKALDDGKADVNISVKRAQYRKGMDRYLTICQDCSKIFDGEFRPSCPYCDAREPDPDLRGPKGDHANVTHKFVASDTTMLIWLGKIVCGQSEKVEIRHSGDRDNPLVVENLTDAEVDERLKKLLGIAERIFKKTDRDIKPESGA